MAKLTTPANRLTALRPILSAPKDEAGRTAYRRKAQPWRALYNTKEWQRLRWSVLQDALFTCAMCGQAEANTAKLVCDHKLPHRGDPGLFWDRGNLQCLCKGCHDSRKQSMERRGLV